MEEKFRVIYSTEEDMYSKEYVKEFDTEAEALAFVEEEEERLGDAGYEGYFDIVKE